MMIIGDKKINCDVNVHYDKNTYYPEFWDGDLMKDKHRAFLIDRNYRRITRVFIWERDELNFVSGRMYSCNCFKGDNGQLFSDNDLKEFDFNILYQSDYEYIGNYYVKHDGEFHKWLPIEINKDSNDNMSISGFYEYDEYINLIRQTFFVDQLCKMVQPENCYVHDDSYAFQGGLIAIRDIAFQDCSFVIVTEDGTLLRKNWL